MLTHYLFKDLLRRRKKEKEKKKLTLLMAWLCIKKNLRKKIFPVGSVFALYRPFKE